MKEYDGYYSFGFKKGIRKITPQYIDLITSRTKYNIDTTIPLNSKVEDGFQTVTFGYWNK